MIIPVIIKAAFGGGGRGMRIVHDPKAFEEAFVEAKNESVKYFRRDEMFIERYVQNPRHIEVQIVADEYGNVVHLGDRDCSIQRRHQKVVEIAPAVNLNETTRQRLFDVSVLAMKKLGYKSVGTIEFLVDDSGEFYFMEMNTRIQVEHPVTEMVSGIDLIIRMIEIAMGDRLIYTQDEIHLRGYAIEFRINAEDSQRNFAPNPGKITEYLSPGGFGVRLDTIAYKGYEIPPYYDSMIGKLIVYAMTWDGVIKKARRALEEYIVEGVATNITLHDQIVKDRDFQEAKFDTSYFDNKLNSFNLEAKDDLKRQEEKIAALTKVIEAIKRHDITPRH